jgi:hypothetical protein
MGHSPDAFASLRSWDGAVGERYEARCGLYPEKVDRHLKVPVLLEGEQK